VENAFEMFQVALKERGLRHGSAAIQIFLAGEDRGKMLTKSRSNKISNIGINVTLRRVRITIVAMENQ